MRVIDDERRIEEAQAALVARLEAAATRRGPIRAGFQGGAIEAMGGWIREQDLWFASVKLESRYWNGFGLGNPFETAPAIAVEINPPIHGVDRQIAGVFLEGDAGSVHLGHRGNIGGARRGTSKSGFLSRFTESLATVNDGDRESEIILICALDDPDFVDRLVGFVRTVARFKAGGAESSEGDWDEFIGWAKRIFGWKGFDQSERDYKLVIASNVQSAKTSLESGDSSWTAALRKCFGPPNNLTYYVSHSRFIKWVEDNPQDAAQALRALWSEGDHPASVRLEGLLSGVPKEVISGRGTRLNIASLLLSGVDPQCFPPYRSELFAKGMILTGSSAPDPQASESETYETALRFLDRIVQEGETRGLQLRDRLDAQGILWSILRGSNVEREMNPEERRELREYRRRAGVESQGSWIFQGNPAYYDLRGALEALSEQTWLVTDHADKIKADDEVFLWESGAEGGILAEATILDEPQMMAEDPREAPFARDRSKFEGERFRVRLRIEEVLRPLLAREEIRAHPGLAGLAILRRPQGTNYPLKRSEVQVISGLLRDRRGASTWWVNQGGTYDRERQHGCVWAPVQNERGQKFSFWTDVSRLKPGDVIIHYAGGIRAISRVESGPTKALRPYEAPEASSGGEGYKALTSYFDLDQAIQVDEIPRHLRKADSGPFTKDGAVKQGYLFPLAPSVARELRRIFSGRWSGDSPWGSATRAPSLQQLAQELYVDEPWLQRIVRLLEQKRQVILYGPPGTGKTFIAQRLADHLAGAPDRVRLIQFHPAYSYEDFVEGYRPFVLDTNGDHQGSGFRLVDGTLKRLAKAAGRDPEHRYVLIIDEINRGNLPKILGELYFLLEYRDKTVELLYSQSLFSLPQNLWIIATMNTADRSIALVDAALRRRFHFVSFFPHEPPISEVLTKWLSVNKPELQWLDAVVRLANQKLRSRHGAIGPSHFLRIDLDAESIRLIWDHSIIPYLEEQFFGVEEEVEKYRLDRLQRELEPGGDAGASSAEV